MWFKSVSVSNLFFKWSAVAGDCWFQVISKVSQILALGGLPTGTSHACMHDRFYFYFLNLDFKWSPRWAKFWPWVDYQPELATRACMIGFLFLFLSCSRESNIRNGTSMAIISNSHFGVLVFWCIDLHIVIIDPIWTLLFNLVWIFISKLQHKIGMVLDTCVYNNMKRMNYHICAHLSFIQHMNLQNHMHSRGYIVKLMWHRN